MKKYSYRTSIEELYQLSENTKKIKVMKTIDEFISWANQFDQAIQGKVAGENFYDFLFLDSGSYFDVEWVIPATEDQDIKEGFDAILKITNRKKPVKVNYKFIRDKNAKVKMEWLEGLKNITNRGDERPEQVGLVVNTYPNSIPLAVREFAWLFVFLDQYEEIVNQTFFKRFADWIEQGVKQIQSKRSKGIKSVKPNKPYTHQIEMRKDNIQRVLSNLAFPGAGKTDDQTDSIKTGFELNSGSNAMHIGPILALLEQNMKEHLLPLIKDFSGLQIFNLTGQHTWPIETDYGFKVNNIKLSNSDDLEYYLKVCRDPNQLTYTTGTYAGFSRYVNALIEAKVVNDWYFDEAASLVPGQQIHTIEGLEDESKLTKAFIKLCEFNHEHGGRMHYWDAVNLTSFDPRGIAFGNDYYFGKYAGNGPYDMQYGIANNIIAEPLVHLIKYNLDDIKEFFGDDYINDDPKLIEAYCLSRLNDYIKEREGYAKTIGYMKTAKDCDPMAKILKKHKPDAFWGPIVGQTKQPTRKSYLKAFGSKRSEESSLLNFLVLCLGISENSANGVFLARTMNDRFSTHSMMRGSRRHPKDKPYQPLTHKPYNYVAMGIDENNSEDLLRSKLFENQIYKLLSLGLDPKITIIDGKSKAKDDDKQKKPATRKKVVSSLTGDEELTKKVEELIRVQKLKLGIKKNKQIVNTITNQETWEDKLKVLEQAL